MDYGNLLSRSWRVVWDHKFMIVLGFLAALGSGMGSNGDNFNYVADSSDFQNLPFIDGPFAPSNVGQFLPALGALAAGALCFAIVLGIALWILRLTAEAGLIDSASRLDAGQKVSFREAMSAGWSKIWNMIALNLLLFGSIFLVILFVILLSTLTIGGSVFAAVAGSAGSGQDFANLLGPIAAIGGGLIGWFAAWSAAWPSWPPSSASFTPLPNALSYLRTWAWSTALSVPGMSSAATWVKW